MAQFAWHIMHWPTVAGLVEYLNATPPPAWCDGLTLHHTSIPTIEQWRGRSSMIGLRNHYENTQKWPSGPQLFIGPDGVWQGTPITQRGTHAGPCNTDRIGIEVVGDYDKGPWREPIRSLVYGTLVALCHWLDIEEARINGHRDCMKNRTCPGRFVDLTIVRHEVGRLLRPTVPFGFHEVDPAVKRFYDLSGGVWRENLYAPGYATTPLFYYPVDALSYQLFERGGVRVRAADQIEWLRTDEVEAMKRWYRNQK